MTLSVSHSVEVQFWCSLQFHFSWFRFVGICLCILWVIYVALGVFFYWFLSIPQWNGWIVWNVPLWKYWQLSIFLSVNYDCIKKKKSNKKINKFHFFNHIYWLIVLKRVSDTWKGFIYKLLHFRHWRSVTFRHRMNVNVNISASVPIKLY